MDRGNQGLKRSVAVDAASIPLGGIAALANRHDAPLLAPTLDVLDVPGAARTVHLDRGCDSGITHTLLAVRGLDAEIAAQGKPAPLTAGRRWVVERSFAWAGRYRRLSKEYEAMIWATFGATMLHRLVKLGAS